MTSQYDWKSNTFKVIESYFKRDDETHLVQHQIKSYNIFVNKLLPEIIYSYNPLSLNFNYIPEMKDYQYKMQLNFKNVSLHSSMIHENNGSTQVMYPSDARRRNFTYSADLFVDLDIKFQENDPERKVQILDDSVQLNKISLGKIPIMLHSCLCVYKDNYIPKQDECKYDKGGYFIINGSEKVVVSQERRTENKVFVSNNAKSMNKYIYIAEINSMIPGKITTPKTIQVKLQGKSSQSKRILLKVSISNIRTDLPIFVIFRALGLISDKNIIKVILLDNELDTKNDNTFNYLQIIRSSLEESTHITTQDDALNYISKYITMSNYNKHFTDEDKKEYIKELLRKEFLPHLGQTNEDLVKKYYFLGYMVKSIIDVYLKKKDVDDRDSYINKRISTPGVLMASLFRQYFSKVFKDMKTQINKEFNNGSWRATNNILDLINVSNIYKIVKYNIIATGLKYSLATGNWGIKNMPSKQGIAQVLSRLTYNSTLSHLRRVNTPIEKSGKFVGPRKLHSTQVMIMCPSETPEGGSIGIVKNLSIGTVISHFVNASHIHDLIDLFGYIDIKSLDINGKHNLSKLVKIFVNGDWIGFTENPSHLYDKLIEYRREGIINIYTGLSWDIFNNNIYINTDAGRCLRPLYIIKNNEFVIHNDMIHGFKNNKPNWDNLISKNTINNNNTQTYETVIEYLDVEESNYKMIAMNQEKLFDTSNKVIKYRYTHCELHPCMMLGVLGSVIPFAEHNQAPRNLFQSAMGKQAMGIYVTNFKERTDSLAHILHYPQIPIVDSKIVKLLPSHNLPCGLNAIVAIASYSGYNQEDSLIVNKDSVRRGLFVSTYYRTYKVEEKKSQASGEDERFCKPDSKNTKGMKMGNYDKLNANGFIDENVKIEANDIIIGKVMRTKHRQNNLTNDILYKDNSQVVRPNETGYVDKVIISRNGDGYRFGKVKIRSVREPVIGDKHSSRHGQKGTVGMLFNQDDMPFTEDGITPDMIMNPHAVPSRMTIGQLKENLLGKASCIQGKFGDATPFTNIKTEDLESILQDECGFHKHGQEILYNGATGEQLQASIFIGPTFYQRLKHMVNDKIHSRSNGPMVTLTRQPAEGRSRDGGLRLGEMEKDCVLGHGASSFLKEILMDKSDNFKMFICKKCGMVAIHNKTKKLFGCKKCQNFNDITEVRVPYACKLFIQELESMAISPRIITKNSILEKK